jgi:hypothetical protein
LAKEAIVLGTHISMDNQFSTRSKTIEVVASIVEEANLKVGHLPFSFHVYVILFTCVGSY